MRKTARLLRPCILPIVLVGSACSQQSTPEKPALALTGRVVDAANLLTTDQKRLLSTKLAALEAHQGAQFAVATTPALQGEKIEDYSIRLARAWGLGSKERNNGLLLLVAPNERSVRIEVGKGLEKVLPNDLCDRIIRHDLTPRFKAGAMFDGINAGVDALIAALETPAISARAKAA